MRFIFSVGLLLISNLILGQINQNFVPQFRLSKKTTHKIPKGQNFTFGYLEVPENRNVPVKAELGLNKAISSTFMKVSPNHRTI